jgi:hypothetical protein
VVLRCYEAALISWRGMHGLQLHLLGRFLKFLLNIGGVGDGLANLRLDARLARGELVVVDLGQATLSCLLDEISVGVGRLHAKQILLHLAAVKPILVDLPPLGRLVEPIHSRRSPQVGWVECDLVLVHGLV